MSVYIQNLQIFIEVNVNVNDNVITKTLKKVVYINERKFYSISEVAEQFNMTTRTIRYYEEIDLLHPQRSEGGQRLFSKNDCVRLRLISRGKKYDFSLREIRDMIQLFDQDLSGAAQFKKSIDYGQKKIKEVTAKVNDLIMLRSELEDLLEGFQEKLNEMECE